MRSCGYSKTVGKVSEWGRWAFGKRMGARTQTEDPSLRTQCRPISGEACRGL